MATIAAVKSNIDKLDLAKEAMGAIVEMSTDVVQLNREQLMEGRVKDGGKFQERYKSPSYAEYKHRRNPIPGKYVPDLYNTGAFQEAMKLKVNSKEEYEIFSTDSKASMLTKKYGSLVKFFGLNAESREDLIKNGYYSEVMDRVRKVTRL